MDGNDKEILMIQRGNNTWMSGNPAWELAYNNYEWTTSDPDILKIKSGVNQDTVQDMLDWREDPDNIDLRPVRNDISFGTGFFLSYNNMVAF